MRKKDLAVNSYREKSRDGVPDIKVVQRHAKKTGKSIPLKELRKILDRERLIYRDNGVTKNACQISLMKTCDE